MTRRAPAPGQYALPGPGAGFHERGQTPFRTPGDRHALCVQPQGRGEVTMFVADPDGHPFDSGPIALLDRQRVEELVATLTAHLAGEAT